MRHTAATSPLLEELTARQRARSADLQARHAAVVAARQTPPVEADAEFAKVLAHYAPRAQAVTVALVSVAAERERLAGQPVQAANGQVGIVKGVTTNCNDRVVARVQEWKGGPFTAYAEDLTVLTGKE